MVNYKASIISGIVGILSIMLIIADKFEPPTSYVLYLIIFVSAFVIIYDIRQERT